MIECATYQASKFGASYFTSVVEIVPLKMYSLYLQTLCNFWFKLFIKSRPSAFDNRKHIS